MVAVRSPCSNHLAEKFGKFFPESPRSRVPVLEWLFWQVGGLGPMAGQNNHFRRYTAEKIEYAITRYGNEVDRLFGVLNRRLSTREFLADTYSIADMASYPWAAGYEMQAIDIEKFPHVKRWLETIKARPAVVRAYGKPEQLGLAALSPTLSDEARKILYGQTSDSLPRS
jgi:GSH-dependent disulfide-bond oxidoreductase